MRQHSDWLATLERAEASRPLPPFTCWYSDCDNIVFPPSTAMLFGADNRLLAGRAHVAMAFDAQLLAQSLAIVETDGADPGK